jgi:hypothetical protein
MTWMFIWQKFLTNVCLQKIDYNVVCKLDFVHIMAVWISCNLDECLIEGFFFILRVGNVIADMAYSIIIYNEWLLY